MSNYLAKYSTEELRERARLMARGVGCSRAVEAIMIEVLRRQLFKKKRT